MGLCSGGLSSCDDGSYGPCQWQQGPAAERCDGQDNNCDTFPDNDMVAPACPEQRGVCAGALKECGGSSGWRDCGDAEYSARAASQGLSYEQEETLRDGKDNDCDGDIDEPTECGCQQQCGTQGCGFDPVCGQSCGTCAVGSCDLQLGRCITGPEPQDSCPPNTDELMGDEVITGSTSVNGIPLSHLLSNPQSEVICFSGNRPYSQAISLKLSVRTRLSLTLTTGTPHGSDSVELREANCYYNFGCSQGIWPYEVVKDPGTYVLVISTTLPKSYTLDIKYLSP